MSCIELYVRKHLTALFFLHSMVWSYERGMAWLKELGYLSCVAGKTRELCGKTIGYEMWMALIFVGCFPEVEAKLYSNKSRD
jgi:hypothetical protein